MLVIHLFIFFNCYPPIYYVFFSLLHYPCTNVYSSYIYDCATTNIYPSKILPTCLFAFLID